MVAPKQEEMNENESAKDESASASVSETTGAKEAFAIAAKDIEAVPDHLLKRVNANVPLTIQQMLAAMRRVDPLVIEIAELLPHFDTSLPDRIRLYGSACLWTHLEVTAGQPTDEEMEAARELRKRLLSGAEELAKYGLLDVNRVKAIRKGRGLTDMVNDLTDLAAVYGPAWEQVKGATAVTREMVDRARVLGIELHERIGKRNGPDAPRAKLRRTRRAAWTLLVREYEQLRRAVAYLRWEAGDVDTIMPPLTTRRRRRVREVTPTGETAEPAPPTSTK